MKDATGVKIRVDDRILLFRPGGGGTVGTVTAVGSDYVVIRSLIDIDSDMRQRVAAGLSERASSGTVLVLK